MKTRSVHALGRVSLALSLVASVLWSSHADAGPQVTGPITAAGGTVSLGDDSGKKGGKGGPVPDAHTVKKGDTLWDICDTYFANPWQWPRVWSYNPEILNPHWIYPGDLVKLKKGGALGLATASSPGGAAGSAKAQSGKKPAPGTIFLRNSGFVYDDDVKQNGELTGSPEDKMLLSANDRVYLRLGSEQAKEAGPGDTLTIYQRTRGIKRADGGMVGDVVQILGSVRLDKIDKDKKLAEGTITESLDVIERGARIGPVDRRIDVVPARTNENDLTGELLESVHPNVMFGQNQVVLIDKGEKEGLKAGNRMFIVRKGDPWQQGLSSTGALTAGKVTLGSETGAVEVKTGETGEQSSDYPDEVIAEIRVVRVRKDSATCIVTQSKRELAPGDRWVAKKGY